VLDAQRLKRYQKLQREERWNSESIADSRARAKTFGKMARRVFEHKLKNREGF
jgi:ribosome biogenesis GTPase